MITWDGPDGTLVTGDSMMSEKYVFLPADAKWVKLSTNDELYNQLSAWERASPQMRAFYTTWTDACAAELVARGEPEGGIVAWRARARLGI